jgi:hypothetical protein
LHYLIVGKNCWSRNNQIDVSFLDVLVYLHVLVLWRKISSVEYLVDFIVSRTVVFTHVMGGVPSLGPLLGRKTFPVHEG